MKKINKYYLLIGLLVFIFFLPNGVLAEGKKLRITVSHANVRDNAGMQGRVVATVTSEMILELINQSGKWYQVKLPVTADGQQITGYVHSSVVEFIVTKQPVKKTTKTKPAKEKSRKIKASKGRGIGLGFKLAGGMSYISSGDVNDGSEGNSNFYAFLLSSLGATVTQDIKTIQFGLDFKGEVLICLTHQFGFAIGGGYINSTSKSELTYTYLLEEGTITFKPTISAIPVTLSLFYNLPMTAKMSLSVSAGGGIYFARYSMNEHMVESNSESWEDYQEDATAVGFGFHGSLGFEFKLSSNIAFVFEALGRYAGISGFEGTYLHTDDTGYRYEETGKLYYFEGSIPSPVDKTFKIVEIRDTPPSASPFVSNVREAKVDFSGFGIKIGIIIRLGK